MPRTKTAHAAAMQLALDHPALKTAHVITGLLLQLPYHARTKVLSLVQQQLVLTLYVDPLSGEREQPADPAQLELLRLHDGLDDGVRITGDE